MRDGMYWSGDLAYRDANGFVYFAGRTSDWMRVDGENLAAAPIERMLLRHPAVSQAAVYAVPDPDGPGDQVAAALILLPGASFDPVDFEAFLAGQPDLGTKSWPRYVRIAESLPQTPTNKVLKRELARQRSRAGSATQSGSGSDAAPPTTPAENPAPSVRALFSPRVGPDLTTR